MCICMMEQRSLPPCYSAAGEASDRPVRMSRDQALMAGRSSSPCPCENGAVLRAVVGWCYENRYGNMAILVIGGARGHRYTVGSGECWSCESGEEAGA